MMRFGDFVKRRVHVFRTETPLLIISLVIAILVWFLISVMVYPDLSQTFESIPLQSIELMGTPAEENGLSVVTSQDIKSVNVRISGSRAKIGDLKKEQLVAKVDVSGVTASGTHLLRIVVESSSDTEFQVVQVDPAVIEVEFDKKSEKVFEVSLDNSNIGVEDGYYCNRDEITIEPKTVTVTGFQSQLDRIAKVEVKPVAEDKLTETTELTSGNVLLYTADGAVKDIETSGLKLENPDFNVTVPVYIKRTLSIVPTISNRSTSYYFDSSIFSDPELCVIEPSEISVVSSSETINEYDTLGTEAISLLEIEPGYSVKVKIDIPDGCKNISGTEEVTITFVLKGYAIKESYAKIAEITAKNLPSAYDISFITSGVYPILVGKEESINSIEMLDIVLQIDLSNIKKLSEDSYSLPVTVMVQGYPDVWAIGDRERYLVTFSLRQKDTG